MYKMAFENLTMNMTALQDITPLNIDLSGSNVFNQIVSGANFQTGDYLILASLIIILFVLYWTLSDKTQLGDFMYDDFRAINIALSVSSLIGLTLVSVGWSGNFVAVGMFIVLYLLSWIGILIYENRE